MTDAHDPQRPLADDEALSAYLSGELDTDEEAALESRLATDPPLAARLDEVAEVVAGLRGLDDVDTPPGFRERLDRRLAAEQGREVSPLEWARTTPGTATSSQPRWRAVGLVAAGLTAVAVAGAGLLQGVGPGPGDEADAPAAMSDAGPGTRGQTLDEEAAPEVGDLDAAGPEAPADGDAAAAVARDEGAALPDDDAVRRRYTGLPQAEWLLGAPADAARQRQAEATAALRASGVHPAGVPATACLDAASDAAGSPAVVVLVESAAGPHGTVLAHVVVTAHGDRFDGVAAVLIAPDGCGVAGLVVID